MMISLPPNIILFFLGILMFPLFCHSLSSSLSRSVLMTYDRNTIILSVMHTVHTVQRSSHKIQMKLAKFSDIFLVYWNFQFNMFMPVFKLTYNSRIIQQSNNTFAIHSLCCSIFLPSSSTSSSLSYLILSIVFSHFSLNSLCFVFLLSIPVFLYSFFSHSLSLSFTSHPFSYCNVMCSIHNTKSSLK